MKVVPLQALRHPLDVIVGGGIECFIRELGSSIDDVVVSDEFHVHAVSLRRTRFIFHS